MDLNLSKVFEALDWANPVEGTSKKKTASAQNSFRGARKKVRQAICSARCAAPKQVDRSSDLGCCDMDYSYRRSVENIDGGPIECQ
jgi:hypothetical protein